MEELIEQIKERIKLLQQDPTDVNIGKVAELTLVNMRLAKINYTRSCETLPIQDLPNCTRVEVIDQKGRSYVNWKPTNKVRLSMQDEGRTAKIFID